MVQHTLSTFPQFGMSYGTSHLDMEEGSRVFSVTGKVGFTTTEIQVKMETNTPAGHLYNHLAALGVLAEDLKGSRPARVDFGESVQPTDAQIKAAEGLVEAVSAAEKTAPVH